MINGDYNGNKITWDEQKKEWFYQNGEKADKPRTCPKCKNMPTEDGHDYCLGILPGVKNACCGHGKEGYIMFNDGTVLRFENLKIEKP